MFKRILVAVDGSAPASHGLRVALGLAKEQDAQLYALHVVDQMAAVRGFTGAEYGAPAYYETMLDDLRKAGRDALAKAASVAAKQGHSLNQVLVETRGSSVAQAIVAQARKLGADLIVMGTHGRRGLRRLVMGSDAENVLREARVPVLLVRGAAPRRVGRSSMPRRAASRKQGAPVRTPGIAPA